MEDRPLILGAKALNQLRGVRGTQTKHGAVFTNGGIPRRTKLQQPAKITLRRADYEREKGSRP